MTQRTERRREKAKTNRQRRGTPAVDSSAPARRVGQSVLLPALTAVVAFLAYANSLSNGFVWDDSIILTRQLPVFDSLQAVFLPPAHIPQYSPDYYRPTTTTSFLIDRALGEDDPYVFHLSVALAHAATSALVCLLGWQLLGQGTYGRAGALFAGLLFAVHPIHTESVAWIAGRSDVLATAFLLAVLIVRSPWPGSWARSVIVGMLTFAALGAKEAGIAVYPLMVMQDVLAVRKTNGTTTSDWLRRYAGAVTAGVIYFILRRATLGEVIGSAPGEAEPSGVVVEILAAFAAYVGKLIWPLPLNVYIDQVPGGPIVWLVIAAALAAAALGVLQLWRQGDSLPLFFLLWVLITLAPSLSIVWKIPDAPMAERYLYLPSVGFTLLVGWLLKHLCSSSRQAWMRGALAVSCVSILSAAATATVRRNRVWSDDVALWQDAAAKSRRSGMAFRSLATAYQKLGRDDEAGRYYELALQRRNDAKGLQVIYNNLGTLAMQKRDFEEASRRYRQALEAYPNAADSLFNLGLSIFYRGNGSAEAAKEALDYYCRAEALSEHDPDIQAALGQALLVLGDERGAHEHMRRALDLGVQEATAAGIRRVLGENR